MRADTKEVHNNGSNRKTNQIIICPIVPILHPPSSIFYGPLKDALLGRRFVDDDELKHSVRREQRDRHTVSHVKVENCADNGVSVENDLHSVKDVPTIYFIVNVGIVSEKKK
jgi:hypothetical protein